MIGVLINVATIVVGSTLGLLLRKGLSIRMRNTVMQVLGLCVVMIGISGAVATKDTLCVIVCAVIGTIVGTSVNIEKLLDRAGKYAERKLMKEGESTFAQGFVTASLVFCVGAMAIVGSLDAGIRHDYSTLVAKAVIDGVTSVIFAGTMGIGVMLSALPILLYQGSIALLAGLLKPLLTDDIIREMSSVGGLLITGIGLNMLFEEKHISVGNMLPAIFLPMLYYPVSNLF